LQVSEVDGPIHFTISNAANNLTLVRSFLRKRRQRPAAGVPSNGRPCSGGFGHRRSSASS
jgi:hypothetical protein